MKLAILYESDEETRALERRALSTGDPEIQQRLNRAKERSQTYKLIITRSQGGYYNLVKEYQADQEIGSIPIIVDIPFSEQDKAKTLLNTLNAAECPNKCNWHTATDRGCFLCKIRHKAIITHQALRNGFFWDDPEEYQFTPLQWSEVTTRL